MKRKMFMPARQVFQEPGSEKGPAGPAPAAETPQEKEAREMQENAKTLAAAVKSANDKIAEMGTKLEKIKNGDPKAAAFIEGRLAQLKSVLDEIKQTDYATQLSMSKNLADSINSILRSITGEETRYQDKLSKKAEAISSELAKLDAQTMKELGSSGVKTAGISGELPPGMLQDQPKTAGLGGLDLKLGSSGGPIEPGSLGGKEEAPPPVKVAEPAPAAEPKPPVEEPPAAPVKIAKNETPPGEKQERWVPTPEPP